MASVWQVHIESSAAFHKLVADSDPISNPLFEQVPLKLPLESTPSLPIAHSAEITITSDGPEKYTARYQHS